MSDTIIKNTELTESIEDFLPFEGAPTAQSLTLETPKNNMFSRETPVSTSFLDEEDEIVDETVTETDTVKAEEIVNTNEILNSLDEIDKLEENVKPNPVEKNEAVKAFSKFIEDGLILPFDDDKDLNEYTVKDWKELIEANFAEKERAIKEQTPKEFFDALPDELQYAAKYVLDGGKDLKGLFKALSHVEEVKSLDPENDAAEIVRQYLTMKEYGSQEDIQKQIEEWEDLGSLSKKANDFQPRLAKQRELEIAETLQKEEAAKVQREKNAQQYVENVYEALNVESLNGIKLDKKTQNNLYAGLVKPDYRSIHGNNTNLLGHLLEKYQFIEPNYPLLVEALWLLSDPTNYKSKLAETVKNEIVSTEVRKLKTAESTKQTLGSAEDIEDKKVTNSTKKISRAQNNFFKRF